MASRATWYTLALQWIYYGIILNSTTTSDFLVKVNLLLLRSVANFVPFWCHRFVEIKRKCSHDPIKWGMLVVDFHWAKLKIPEIYKSSQMARRCSRSWFHGVAALPSASDRATATSAWQVGSSRAFIWLRIISRLHFSLTFLTKVKRFSNVFCEVDIAIVVQKSHCPLILC